MKKILFVCTGNICRSPLCEGVFKDIVKKNKAEADFYVDSSAVTSYEIGNPPDRRTYKLALSRGIKLEHKARRTTKDDIKNFDLILAMENYHVSELLKLCNSEEDKKKIELFTKYDPQTQVPYELIDPWSEGESTFIYVQETVERVCQNLFEKLK